MVEVWRTVSRHRTVRLGAGIALLIVLAVTFTGRTSKITTSSSTQKHDKSTQAIGCGPHVDRIRGQDVIWELPVVPPRGVVLFSHGCHHAAGDMWPPSPACPTCLGLPEEVRLRTAVLRRRLVLVGISSLDRVGKRCWAELKRDGGANVAAIMRDLLEREGLENLPVYTMGASSGGQMALTLPTHMNITGVYSQVRGLEDLSTFKLPHRRVYPPSAFVYMPRDEPNLPIITKNIEMLRVAKVPVLDVPIFPRPVTPEFLSERSPLIDLDMGKRIVDALTVAGVTTPNGTLLQAPRPVTSQWAPLVQPVIGDLSLELDESHVGELVNLAWAKHELVSDEAEAVLAWLQGGGKGGLEEARRTAEVEGREYDAERKCQLEPGVSYVLVRRSKSQGNLAVQQQKNFELKALDFIPRRDRPIGV